MRYQAALRPEFSVAMIQRKALFATEKHFIRDKYRGFIIRSLKHLLIQRSFDQGAVYRA